MQADGTARNAWGDSTVDLPGLLGTLRRRWLTLLLSIVLFSGLAVLALTLIAPRYTASARILIDPRQQRAVQNEILQSGYGPDMALVESQVEVLTSEAVLKRVVASNDLANDAEFTAGLAPGQDPSVAALEGLATAVKATRPENTYVLQVAVTTREAAKSARLANAIASAYLDFQTESSADTARGISSAIRDRLSELEAALHRSEEEVEAFKRDHNVSESDGQLLADRQLTDLATRRAAAFARVNEAKTRRDVMQQSFKSRGDVGAAASASDDSMSLLRTQLATAQRNLAELSRVLGPRHPRVIGAEGDVAQARASIRAESQRLVQNAEDDYQAAQDGLTLVNSDLEGAQSNSFDTNKDLIRLRELTRRAQSNRVVYESFLVRAKETAEQENIAPQTARVIADAAVPAVPSFPPRVPLLIGAALLGLFVGIPAAIVQDLVAGTLRARRRAVLPEPAPVALLPPAPVAAAVPVSPAPASPVTVVSALDPALARRTALDLAFDEQAEGRGVIFVDFAPDAPTDVPGFAELANGTLPVSDAIEVERESGLHIINAGRADAVRLLPAERAEIALRAIIGEYDRVVVNTGRLHDPVSALAQAAGRSAGQRVFAVEHTELDRAERDAFDALNRDGAPVSVVSAEAFAPVAA